MAERIALEGTVVRDAAGVTVAGKPESIDAWTSHSIGGCDCDRANEIWIGSVALGSVFPFIS